MATRTSLLRPGNERLIPACLGAALISVTILCGVIPYLNYLEYLRDNAAEAARIQQDLQKGWTNHGPWYGAPAGFELMGYLIVLFLLPGCSTYLGILVAYPRTPNARRWITIHWIFIVIFQIWVFCSIVSKMGWLLD